MKLKIKEIGDGFYPQEVLVEIRSTSGNKSMLIDRRSIDGSFVRVGSPIAKKEDISLVELPRETTVGEWRVWVSADQLTTG